MPRALVLARILALALALVFAARAGVGCGDSRTTLDGGTSDDEAGRDATASDDAGPPCTALLPGPAATGTSVDGPPPTLTGGAITVGVYDLTVATMYSGAGDGGTTPTTGPAAHGALALGADASFAILLTATGEGSSLSFAGTYEQSDAGLALALTCPSWASDGTLPYEATPTTIALQYSSGGSSTSILEFSLRR